MCVKLHPTEGVKLYETTVKGGGVHVHRPLKSNNEKQLLGRSK